VGTSAAQTLTALPPILPPIQTVATNVANFMVTSTLQPVAQSPSPSSSVYVQVTTATNCRKGPGQSYDAIGALQVGERALVVGKYPPANYWIIEDPRGGGTCWLWGQYATIEGDASQLPIMTPFPLPTQSAHTPSTFTLNVQFYDLDLCGQDWVLAFEIASPDVGAQGMHSAEISVMDVTAGNVQIGSASSNQPFCLHPCGPCESSAGGGAWTIVAVPIGSDPRHGHNAAAKIVVCTQDNLGGSCAAADFSFLIP
ncbi:MAG: hypothetical protein ACPL4H_06010, partial [Anaerolineales bacterium]